MKAETFNYKEYEFTVIGHIPTGQNANTMLTHAIFLSLEKGTFKMQVEHKGYGTISTINFKKLNN
jgi:hypothetical protein